MQQIDWQDFMKVELRVGKIVQAEVFEQARKLHTFFMWILERNWALKNPVRKLHSCISRKIYWGNWSLLS